VILPLDLPVVYPRWSGLCTFFGPPSGYRLTYDLGGVRSRHNNRKRQSLTALASLAALLFGLALGSVPAVRAQSEHISGRKIIRTQQPDYPAVLKRQGIGGTVRLRASVLASGTVVNIDVLGGDAVLAESAAKAVMSWKYAPAASPSNEIVTIQFSTR
jgi:TonB family protein